MLDTGKPFVRQRSNDTRFSETNDAKHCRRALLRRADFSQNNNKPLATTLTHLEKKARRLFFFPLKLHQRSTPTEKASCDLAHAVSCSLQARIFHCAAHAHSSPMKHWLVFHMGSQKRHHPDESALPRRTTVRCRGRQCCAEPTLHKH
jgi:hypothetical protein